MVLKNKILCGVLVVVVIVCLLQKKTFSQTHPSSESFGTIALDGFFIPKSEHSSSSDQTDNQDTYHTNAKNHQLIALNTEINSPSPNSQWNDGRESKSNAGQIPTNAFAPGEDLIITSTQNITINTNTTYRSIIIETGGTLTIDNGITLTVEEDWTNDGTFTANESTVEFNGTIDATISGTSASEFYNIRIDKGTDVSSIVEANGTGLISNTGTIEIVSGVFKMTTGSFQLGGSSAYTIPATGGIWVNGATLSSGNYAITNQGLIHVSAGTADFGDGSDNNIQTQASGDFQVSGGAVNIAGGLEILDGAANISGGLITLADVGNSSPTVATLQLSSSSNFNMTAGTIVFAQPNSVGYLDVSIADGTGTKSMTGGTFQFGNSETSPRPTSFSISSKIPIPNIETYDYIDLELASPLTITDLISYGENSRIELNGHALQIAVAPGGTYNFPITDNGALIPLTVQITGGSGSGTLSVSTTTGKHPNNANLNNYLNRQWDIDINGITSLVYDINATYDPTTDVVGDESKIATGAYGGSLPWQKFGAADTIAHSIAAKGLTDGSMEISGITAENPSVSIDQGPTATICDGESIDLTTTATGDPTLTYEWSTSSTTAGITVSPKVTTTYTITVTDGNGFEADDQIEITVNAAPAFTTCPLTPIALNTLLGSCSNTASYTAEASGSPAPIYTYNFDGATTGSGDGTGSGETFNIGTTTVTVTATNSCGTDVCSFTVTVTDNEDPVISCPVNITQTADPGTCGAVVTFAATATDNCSAVVTYSQDPGTTFPVGTTTVTATATDPAGNTDVCSFTVTVTDNEDPVKPTITSVTRQCEYTPASYPTTTDNCDGTITGAPNVTFPYTTRETTTIVWTFTDNAGNSTTANQIVTINDTQAPSWVTFPADVLNAQCGTDTSPATTGTPTATDNCDTPTITYTNTTVQGNCAGRYTVTRTWRAEDSSGNSTSKDQKIYVDDTTPPVLVCNDFSVATPDDIPLSDELIGITATDNCGLDTIIVTYEYYYGLEGAAGFCPTSVERRYIARDECGNESEECTQIITVEDAGSCELCQEGVPFEFANLHGSPDSLWISQEWKRDGVCCGVTQEPGEGPPRCISFNVYLDEDAVGLIFNIESGAEPSGALFYQIDCGPEIQVGEEICLTGGQFYLVTFCKPGNNKNTYSIQSISGATTTEDIVTRADEGCTGTISVTGLEPTADITWTVKSPNDQTLLRYLDTTDPLNPTFTADADAPATIIYEVCGTLVGTYVCEGEPILSCAEVTVTVLQAIDIDFNIDLDDICEDEIPLITAEIVPADYEYEYEWYDDAGNLLSTSPSWQPTQEGDYSLVVTENESGVSCNSATYDFTIAYDYIPPVFANVPATLELDCNDPDAEVTIQNWLALATASDGESSSVEVFNDYQIFDHSCDLTVPVNFWAMDACGNRVDSTSYIHINDTQAPVITQQGIDGWSDCSTLDPDSDPGYLAWLASHAGALATDECDTDLAWTNNSPTATWSGDPANNTITITFTVTDDCGNTAQTTASYTITDDQPPTIICPEAVTETAALNDCYKILESPTDPTMSDNCSVPDLSWTMSGATTGSGTGTVTGETFNVGVTTVTYTATDAANLTATCSFNVTILDVNPPVYTVGCPEDIDTVADAGICGAVLNIPAPEVEDLCNEIISVTHNSPYSTNPNDASGTYPVGTTQITWTATDASGNETTCVQVITVEDTQAPEITCPVDVVDEITNGGCDMISGEIGEPVISDNCPNPLLSYVRIFENGTTDSGNGSVSGLAFPVGQTTVTYTVTDGAGLTAECTFTVWIKNLDAPQFAVACRTGAEKDLIVSTDPGVCEADVTVLSPVITNPCNEVYTIVNDSPYKTSNEDASGTYPIGTTTVNWLITDASGNEYPCVQTITIEDTQAPEITCPADVVDEITNGGCDMISGKIGEPVISDNCPNPLLSYVRTFENGTTDSGDGSVSGLAFPVGQTSVTYTVTDGAGLTAECTFTVWIKNLDAPQFAVACRTGAEKDLIVSTDPGVCEADVTVLPPVIFNPCNEVYTIVNDSPYKTSNANASGTYPIGTTTINWLITDASGNEYLCIQTVTVEDTQAPEITCPANVVDEITNGGCDMISGNIEEPGVSDNCPNPLLSYLRTFENGTTDSGDGSVSGLSFPVGQTTVTYTVTDGAGLTDECTFTVWIKNLDAPRFDVDCREGAEKDLIVSTDPGVCEADVTVLPPVITNPCNEVYTIVNDSPYKTSNADPSGIYPVGTTTVTWTIVDASGTTYECIQTVTVVDNEDPVWDQVMPAEITVECDEVPLEPASITATDNCDIDVVIGYTENRIDGPCPDTYTLERTWTATDNAGNQTSYTQTITVQDNSLPVWSQAMPADVTVECTAIPAVPVVAATDACDPDVTVVFDEVNNAASGCGTITRTWVATDNCGNTLTHAQTITVVDTNDPIISGPPSRTIEACNVAVAFSTAGLLPYSPTASEITLAELQAEGEGADASDNCSLDYITYQDTLDGSCPWIVTRTYTAFDECGNQATAPQQFTITIDDTTPPTASNPTPINVECAADVPTPNIAVVTDEADDCGAPVVAWVDDVSDGETCPEVITRTYSVTDACGNSITVTQLITINDDILPTITCPGSLTAVCDISEHPAYADFAAFQAAGGSASDNCDIDESSFILLSEVSDNNTCPEVVTRTYQIADLCGNVQTCTQTIIIHDTEAPAVSIPDPIELEACTSTDIHTVAGGSALAYSETVVTISLAQLNTEGITSTDNCVIASITYQDASDGETCPETITRTFTVTDACNNSSSVTQTITIGDTTNPVISCPDPQTVPADWEQTYGTVTLSHPNVSDNCTTEADLNLSWVMTGATEAIGTGVISSPYPFNIGTTTVTYTVEDACGNTAQCQFVITITAKPEIACAPDIEQVADADACHATLDPRKPTLVQGALPITWTWTILDEDGLVVTSGSEERNDTQAPTITPNPYDFPVGVTTIKWKAENFSGADSCLQTITITDEQAPVITELNALKECVESLLEATYYAPTTDITPTRPEYYIFEIGSTDLDIDLTTVIDNCDPDCTYSVRWRIDFAATTIEPASTLTGNGQLSDHDSAIHFPGDGVNFTNVVHTITYWVTDCHGNESALEQTTVTVTPRPNIIKNN